MTRALAAALAAAVAGGCAGDPPPPEHAPPSTVRAPQPGILRIAGSGAMVPLARALAAAYREEGVRVVVEESVGSGGGVRAVLDGAVDLGMVSRPLSDEEARLGLAVVPAGTDAVVLAAHPQVAAAGVAADEARALFAGERRTFADGAPATVLLRERGESGNAVLGRAVPGLAGALDTAWRRGRARVLYHDQAMVEALAATPDAVGMTGLGVALAARPPVKVLAVDGVAPSVDAVADGRWRATRPLAWVARPERMARAARFLAFARSDEGRRVARAAGYLP